MINNDLKFIQFLVYPPTCLLCGNSGANHKDLCDPCRQDLPLNHHACRGCALPLPAEVSGHLCGRCLRKAPVYQETYTSFAYRSPIDRLLLQLKFQAHLVNAKLLGQLMTEDLSQRAIPLPQLLIPVPLHPQRLRERGFNQALELARPIAKQLQIPLVTNYCKRTRSTNPQMGLDPDKRKSNIRGAFTVVKAPTQKHVAIIDDVITTGATVTELAQVLLKAGVVRVSVWACARTLR